MFGMMIGFVCFGGPGHFLGFAVLVAAGVLAGYWLGRGRKRPAKNNAGSSEVNSSSGNSAAGEVAQKNTDRKDTLATRVYSFESLNKLSVSGCWRVDIDCAADENSCRISTAPELMDQVRVEQERGGIKIRYTARKRPIQPMLIEVRSRELIPMLKSSGENTVQCRKITGGAMAAKIAYGGRFFLEDAALDEFLLKCSGSSSAECDGNFTLCEAEIDGGSSVVLSGKLQCLKSDISGASKLEAAAVREAELEVSGASRVKIEAAESLSGSVSGASTVKYSGAVRAVRFRTSGSSRVKRTVNE